MGAVYQVHRRGWNRDLALKVPQVGGAASESLTVAFEHECHTWASLPAHPHVAACHFVQRFEGLPLIFLEYVAGGSVQDWIATRRLYAGVPAEALYRVLAIAHESAAGLAHAHGNGLVHQDVKPANLLLTDDGQAKVTDFGLARAASRSAAGGKAAFAGMTPAYCSPEQGARESLTPATDVWSWAVTVLEMFTGEIRWRMGQAAPAVLEEGEGTSSCALAMPGGIRRLLGRCFAPDPAARPTMDEIVGELQSTLRAMEMQQGVPPRPRPASPQYMKVVDANNRGVALAELGQWRQAAALLESAVSESSNAVEPWFNLCLLKARGYYDSLADETFVRHAGSSGHLTLAHTGMLQLELGQPRKAADTLSRALTAGGSGNVDTINAFGIALLLSGEPKPARRLFEEALSLDPDRRDCLRNLAIACYLDGSASLSRRLFRYLEADSLFDAHERCACAVAQSAAGYPDAAAEALRAAATLSGEPLVRFTVHELMHGSQSFLPGVMPVPGAATLLPLPLDELAQGQPRNLRAAVDLETLPSRFGLTLGAIVRDRSHVLPEGLSAPRLGGALASSYRLVTQAYRWGDVHGLPRQVAVFALSALPPALLAAAACAAAGTHGEEWALVSSIVVAAALLCGMGGAPFPRLIRGVLTAAPALAVLVYGACETALQFGYSTGLPFGATFGIALGVLLFWQYLYQRLTREARAFPQRGLPELLRGFGRRRPAIYAELARASGGDRLGDMKARARAALHNIAPALTRRMRAVRAGLIGWYWCLIPQLLVGGAALFKAETEHHYLAPLLFPALMAPFAPHAMLRINTVAAVATGVLGMDLWSAEPGTGWLPLAAAGFFLYANIAAMQRCPALAPEWTDCRVKGWDLRDAVDPLRVRERAVPWLLIDPDEAGRRKAPKA